MKVAFEGRERELDPGRVTFRQALAIQKQTGMSLADWEDSLDFKAGPDGKVINPPPEWLTSVGALYWLMCAQNGEEADPDRMDFDVTGFLQAYYAALGAEVARLKAQAPPDPTRPPPMTLSPPGDPLPSAPATPTDTTPPPPVLQEGAAIAS